MTMISLRLPEETVAELKRVAPLLGFTGYQPLIRVYVTQRLQENRARLGGGPQMSTLVENLKEQGIDSRAIEDALAETRALYDVRTMPEFVSAPPRFVEATESNWGKATANLLSTPDTSEWEEAPIGDAVEWVAALRDRQRANRGWGEETPQ